MRTGDSQLLIGRVLIAALFIPAGIQKLLGRQGIVHALTDHQTPLPLVGGIIAVVREIVVAGLILLGVQVRRLAMILAIFTVATAVIGHPFWEVPPPAYAAAYGSFFKNLALAGGLLGLSAAGAGCLALWRHS
ncbi:MAG: DoxX family protein [Acetobacteraceae bacterium]